MDISMGACARNQKGASPSTIFSISLNALKVFSGSPLMTTRDQALS